MPSTTATRPTSSRRGAWRKKPERTEKKVTRLTEILEAIQREVLQDQRDFRFGKYEQYRIILACDPQERREARSLLPPNAPNAVLELLPGSTTLLAQQHGRPVGTLSIYSDGPMGLPFDRIWPKFLEPLRCQSRRIIEMGNLGLSPRLDLLSARSVLRHLFKAASAFARKIEDCSDIVLTVEDKHLNLMERFFFSPMSGPDLGRLPLHLKVGDAEISFVSVYSEYSGNRNLDWFFRENQDYLLDCLKDQRRPLSEPDLAELLEEHRDAFSRLSLEDRHAFQDVYLAYDIGSVLENGGATPDFDL